MKLVRARMSLIFRFVISLNNNNDKEKESNDENRDVI